MTISSPGDQSAGLLFACTFLFTFGRFSGMMGKTERYSSEGGVWLKKLLLILWTILLAALCGCGGGVRQEVAKTGAVTAKTLEGDVSVLEVKEIFLKQGTSSGGPRVVMKRDGKGSRVVLEGPSDLLEEVKTDFSGRSLKIAADSRKSYTVTDPLTITLYDCTLSSLHLSGACEAEAESNVLVRDLSGTRLEIRLAGASSLKADQLAAGEVVMDITGASALDAADMKCDKWKLDLTGASTLNVEVCTASQNADWHVSGAAHMTVGDEAADPATGGGAELFAVLAGAAQVNAAGFEVKKATLTVSGGSTLDCRVTDVLGGSITGSSTVRYIGMPTLATHVGSSSHLEKR